MVNEINTQMSLVYMKEEWRTEATTLFHWIIYSMYLPWRCLSSCSAGSSSYLRWSTLWCNFPWLHQLILWTDLLFVASLWEYSKLFKGSCCRWVEGIQQSRASSCFTLGSSYVYLGMWWVAAPSHSCIVTLLLAAGKKLYAFALSLPSGYLWAVAESCDCWQFFWFSLFCTEDLQVDRVIWAHIFPSANLWLTLLKRFPENAWCMHVILPWHMHVF